MLSRISANRDFGSPKGNNGHRLHSFCDFLFQSTFFDQIYFAIEHIGELSFDTDEVEKRHIAEVFKDGFKIHIRAGAGFVAGHGTEDAQTSDPRGFDLRLVGAQCR